MRLLQIMWIMAMLCGHECRAQGQQYLLDTINDGSGFVLPPSITATTDGGTLLNLSTMTLEDDLVWKIDQTGEPLWCKQYGISSERRARMPDGGVVFCEVTGYIPDGDTNHIHLQVVRTDAQGLIIWSKSLTIHDPYVTLFNNLWLRIASDVEGKCLLTMSELGGSAYQWFYSMDAEGELLWSRNFLFNVNADHVEHICSDGLGGWFFGSYEQGASVFRMGKLNFVGDLAWYNSYAVPNPQEFWLGGICSLGFAPVAVGGFEAVFNEDYRWFIMRLNLNGTLNWFRVSAASDNVVLASCKATTAGELLAFRESQAFPLSMVRFDGNGEVLSGFSPIAHAVAGTTYASWFVDWDHFDTALTMANFLISTSDTSGFPSYQPAVWRLPIAALSACGTEANELSSVLAFNSNVAVQDQPFSEVVVPVTITDTICTVTSFTPFTVSDYCYYFTGIPPVVQAATLGRVLTTLLVPGDPITVLAPAARCGITVHDAQGRMLHQGLLAAHGNGSIPTTFWSPGLYFVRFQPEDGGNPNVVKVVIE